MDDKFEYEEMVRVAKHAIEADQKNLVELSIKLAEVQQERDALAEQLAQSRQRESMLQSFITMQGLKDEWKEYIEDDVRADDCV